MSSSSSSFSSALASLKSSPGALVATGAALGTGAMLLATHLTGAWCPAIGRQVGARGGCPISGRASSSCPASSGCASKQTETAVAKKKEPLVVTITGAGGQIGYAILFQIAQGRMLGADQPIELRLLEIEAALPFLQGILMELEDCALPLVTKVVPTSDHRVAFDGCDIALLIGARPRGPGMNRSDLLKANAAIFKQQGKALNDYAKKSVKVLVVGNPANTNAKIAMDNAPDLPKTAFSAMTRLDELRAKAQVAKKAGVNVDAVKNVIVWGNHSDTQYPDLTFATVTKNGVEVPAMAAIGNDTEWAQGPFLKTVQQRGAAVIDAMKKSSAASAANAAVEHVRSWHCGTKPGEYVSMAVCSNGEYGVPAGLIYSFPCECRNGEYRIVAGLEGRITPYSAAKMQTSWEQLQDEDQQWRQDATGSS